MLRATKALPAQQLRGTLAPNFVADLKAVYDADSEKDADEWVPVLAEIFETRRLTIRARWLRFLTHLKAVYDSEADADPEEYLPLLASRFNAWRSQSLRRMQEYLASLPEDDPLRCPVSLFGALGLGRVEQAHTNALAWLLDPRQSHDLKTCLLNTLLGRVAYSTPPSNVNVHEMRSEYPLFLYDKRLGRIDVYGTGTWITGDRMPSSWLLAIEAKIDAREGDGQLERYDKWIEARRGNRYAVKVFLTPEGRQPEAAVTGWVPLSFLELVRIFREPYPQLRDRCGFHLLRFYLTGILKDICRWKIPVGGTDCCDDPYGIVDYLKTVRSSNQGERHGSTG